MRAVNATTYAAMGDIYSGTVTLCRDGTSKAGQELTVGSVRSTQQSFTITPWPQATKSAQETHTCTVEQLDSLEKLYLDMYNALTAELGENATIDMLVPPREIGSGIMKIRSTMTDHAVNERAANNLFAKLVTERAPKFIKNWSSLSKGKQQETTTLVQAFCFDHK